MAFDGRVLWEENSCLYKACNLFQLEKITLTAGYFPQLPTIIYISGESAHQKSLRTFILQTPFIIGIFADL